MNRPVNAIFSWCLENRFGPPQDDDQYYIHHKDHSLQDSKQFIPHGQKTDSKSSFSIMPINPTLLYILKWSILLGISTSILRLWLQLDVNKRVYNHRPGECKVIDGIKYGSEDIELVESSRIAFISSGVRPLYDRGPNAKGRIYLYDYDGDENSVIETKINGIDLTNFFPHGISANTINNKTRLFVINHDKENQHSIILFDFDRKSNSLNHVKTIEDEKFIRPNGIIALNHESFIITNDGSAQTQFTHLMEAIWGGESGSIVIWDGKEKSSHFLLSNTISPNGLVMNKERTHLIVAHVNLKRIKVYEMRKDRIGLTEIASHHIETMPDNLFMDQYGTIWVGAHPVALPLVMHLLDVDNPEKYSPSQVLRIKFSSNWQSYEISEVYSDDGRQACASSVAIHYDKRILIGTIFRELILCHISHPDVIAIN